MTGRGALSALTFAVLVNSAAPGGDTAIVARTLMRIDASDLRPCRWARFCPVNSAYVLASAGGGGILLETVGGRTTALRDGDGPIGWLRESIVVVQAPPRYVLLECPSLRPATRVAGNSEFRGQDTVFVLDASSLGLRGLRGTQHSICALPPTKPPRVIPVT